MGRQGFYHIIGVDTSNRLRRIQRGARHVKLAHRTAYQPTLAQP